MKRLFGEEADLNSDTLPPKEMKSPTVTDFNMVAELEKIKRPFDSLISADFSPRI